MKEEGRLCIEKLILGTQSKGKYFSFGFSLP